MSLSVMCVLCTSGALFGVVGVSVCMSVWCDCLLGVCLCVLFVVFL